MKGIKRDGSIDTWPQGEPRYLYRFSLNPSSGTFLFWCSFLPYLARIVDYPKHRQILFVEKPYR